MARLAGLPLTSVIERPRQILVTHESAWSRVLRKNWRARTPGALQIQLFEPVNGAIADRIRRLKLDELRPIEALQLLAELQKELS